MSSKKRKSLTDVEKRRLKKAIRMLDGCDNRGRKRSPHSDPHSSSRHQSHHRNSNSIGHNHVSAHKRPSSHHTRQQSHSRTHPKRELSNTSCSSTATHKSSGSSTAPEVTFNPKDEYVIPNHAKNQSRSASRNTDPGVVTSSGRKSKSGTLTGTAAYTIFFHVDTKISEFNTGNYPDCHEDWQIEASKDIYEREAQRNDSFGVHNRNNKVLVFRSLEDANEEAKNCFARLLRDLPSGADLNRTVKDKAGSRFSAKQTHVYNDRVGNTCACNVQVLVKEAVIT